MEKLNCDIIQDLIPSYVDEVCSEATKECVEEHLKSCGECRKIVNLCKKNGFSAAGIEQKELDWFKKIKEKTELQNLLGFGVSMPLALVLFGIYMLELNQSSEMNILCYILLPGCLISIFLSTANKGEWKCAGKIDFLLAGGSALATVCWVWLVWHGLSEFTQERNPFELADRDVGPTYHFLMWIFFLVQIVFLACIVKRLLKKNIDCRWILAINFTGIFLLLAHSTLFKLDSLEYFTGVFNQITGIVLALGMIGTVLYAVCAWRKR